MKEPVNPPNVEGKWKSLNQKMKHREDEINRIVETHKQSLIDNGFKYHNMQALVRVGYAMALEDNNLEDW